MIYFLRFKSSLIKIGCTNNLAARCHALKGVRWYGDHDVLKTIDGEFEEEQALHLRFNHLRLYHKLELFAPGKDLMDFIGCPEHARDDVSQIIRNHWILAVQLAARGWRDRGLPISREDLRKAAISTLPDRNLHHLQPSAKGPYFDSLFGCAWPPPPKYPRHERPEPSPDAELYTLQDAAKLLGMSRGSLVSRLKMLGCLIRIGNCFAVRRADLERLRSLKPGRRRRAATST